MGLGLFPPIFTLNFTWDDIYGQVRPAPGGQSGGPNASNNEDVLEPLLKRFLIFLVICLFAATFLFGSDVYLEF